MEGAFPATALTQQECQESVGADSQPNPTGHSLLLIFLFGLEAFAERASYLAGLGLGHWAVVACRCKVRVWIPRSRGP